MNPEVEGMVSELYALRAGLSAVSQEYDGFRNDCKKAYDALAGARSKTKQLEEQRTRAREDLQSAKNSLSETKKELGEKRGDERKLAGSAPVRSKTRDPFGIFLSVLFGILGLVFLLVCAYVVVGVCVAEKAIPDWRANGFLKSLYECWFIEKVDGTVTYDFTGGSGTVQHEYGILILIAGIVAFILACVTIWLSIRRAESIFDDSAANKSEYKKDKGERERKKANLRSEITALESRAKRAESEIPLKEQKIATLEQELGKARIAQGITDEKEFAVALAKRGNDHLFAGKALYEGLLEQFRKTIDERDWKNLDYVIYAIETGRADSMKEALQMLDKELQTERLERSMAMASEQISQTVSHGLRNLQAQMEVCFHALTDEVRNSARMITGAIREGAARTSAMIAASAEATNARIDQLNGSVQAGNARLAQISTSSALNSALLAKANENSQSLVQDVNRLRTYADYRWRKDINTVS